MMEKRYSLFGKEGSKEIRKEWRLKEQETNGEEQNRGRMEGEIIRKGIKRGGEE
jgi:hypothetical protein